MQGMAVAKASNANPMRIGVVIRLPNPWTGPFILDTTSWVYHCDGYLSEDRKKYVVPIKTQSMWSLKHAPTQTNAPHSRGGCHVPREGTDVSTSTTASVTYNTKSLIKQLEATRDRMNKEIAEWEDAASKLPAKQKAWDKKARAWFKKNAASLIDDDTDVHNRSYQRDTTHVELKVDTSMLTANIGPSPEGKNDSRPQYDQTNYNQKVAPLEEIENAIAMFKGCTDTDIKVSMKSAFFRYLR